MRPVRPVRILVGARGVNKTSWFWPSTPPTSCVLFFPGDDVAAADTHPDVLRLSSPTAQAAAAAARWPYALVVVVTPSRHEGGYACFDHFLPGTTRSGEPLGTSPTGLPSLSQAASLLASGGWPAASAEEAAACRAPVPLPGVRGGRETPPAPPPPPTGPWPPTRVIGFSKGGTIVSQLLSELACIGERGAEAAAADGAHPAATTLAESIRSLLYIDSGLNCRGSHVTDPSVATGLASLPHPPTLEIHGTSRQWRDARRPWLAAEAGTCERLMREAGVGVTRVGHGGLGGGVGSHFRVIEAALRGGEGNE